MAHDHNHSHGTGNVSDGVLLWTVIVNLGLSVFEFGAGVVSGSVALMADALHNTNDAAALGIAYIARKISRKGADETYTFGYRRAELIGAMIQLTALIVVGLYLVYEAVKRMINPEPLLGEWMMIAAGVALVVDIATAWLLWSMSKGSLNVKAAFLHNLTDAAASLAVLAGGAAITWLDWSWVDPVLTLGIAGYILWMSVGLLKKTSRILMEGAPDFLDPSELKEAVTAIESVIEIHHLHIWQLDEEHCSLEAHIVVDANTSMSGLEELKVTLKELLHDQFRIEHSTLEFEMQGMDCEDHMNHRKHTTLDD
ncbi:cation diffusion facilitator family transporter [Kiritimatiellaeota bacterium B1221]|nr:cation diffusion facilitator family transporter [Kiritimatiellaeota bacterium B1221]